MPHQPTAGRYAPIDTRTALATGQPAIRQCAENLTGRLAHLYIGPIATIMMKPSINIQRILITPAAALLAVIPMLAGLGCAAKSRDKPEAVDLYVQGATANQNGDSDKALAALLEAVRVNPELTMARPMLGKLYRAREDYRNAAVQYQAATRLDPYEFRNHYWLGLSYQLLDQLQEAADSYLSALKLNPRDPNSNMNLGLVYLALGDAPKAEQFIERATVIDPKSADAFANLGVALDAQMKYALAESAYRRSLDLDSTQTATRLNLGNNLIRQGKASEAVSVLAEVAEQANTPLARKRYGDALALARQYEAAIREYHAALNLDPRYYPAMNEIGSALIAQYKQGLQLDDEQRKAALFMWEKSLEINPRQPRVEAMSKQWNQPGL